MQHVVILQQNSRYGWQLVAPKGHILVDDLSFTDLYRAELWVKAYISSFPCWDYVIKTKQEVTK